MLSPVVVSIEPGPKLRASLGRAAVDASVGPFAQHRLDEALGLAVGARPVRPCSQVPEPQLAAGNGVNRRDIGRAVVGHHPLDRDAALAKPRHRPVKEADGARAALIGEDLDVGETSGVIDADVAELPADDAAAAPRHGCLGQPATAPAGDPMAGALEAPELLDVDVDELARPGALVAVRRLGWLQARALAEPKSAKPDGDG